MNRYTAFFDFDGICLTGLPRNVSKELANKQIETFNKHMMQFPGGTQSVSCWITPTD